MHSTTLPFAVPLPADMPFAVSLTALAHHLQTVPDRRNPRGLRYPLPVLLALAVLATCAGQGVPATCLIRRKEAIVDHPTGVDVRVVLDAIPRKRLISKWMGGSASDEASRCSKLCQAPNFRFIGRLC